MPSSTPGTEFEIRLKLTPDARNALAERARKEGQAVDEYASHLVERAVLRQTADEALAPFRKQVAESGMSDVELDDFFECLRETAFRDRQIGKQ